MSRILACECGFYMSFGHSTKYALGDPFYKYNPICPKCGKPLYRGECNLPQITLQELMEIMKGDIPIMLQNFNPPKEAGGMRCLICDSKNIEPIAGKVYRCKEPECKCVWDVDV